MTMRLVHLEQIAVLVFGGADQRSFLQGQLTQDLLRLDDAGTLLTGWCNPKGRLLATGQLLAAPDETWWLLPAELAEQTVARLQMFVLRADVQIRQLELHVHGLLDFTPEQSAAGLQLSGRRIDWSADGQSALLAVAGSANRALLLGRNDMQTLLRDDTEKASPNDWTLADVRDGLPGIHAATVEAFVPQQVNLDLLDGISFSKGCYVGQEVVARTQHLGRIKRRMYRYAAKHGAAPGDSLVDAENRPAGKVVRSAAAGTGFELLAVVPIDLAAQPLFTQPGTECLKALPLPYPMPPVEDGG